MRAAIYNGPYAIEVGNRPAPVVTVPTDAVVHVVLGCVCGSDLWYYRGGSPHALGPIGIEFPVMDSVVYRNIGLRGGVAPARSYIPELLDDVLEDRINPGRVLDFETNLDGIPETYATLNERRAIKSLVRVGTV